MRTETLAEGHKPILGQMNNNRSGRDLEFIRFVTDIFHYITLRLRQVVVWSWTIISVSFLNTDNIKKSLMRYVFWGRGSWYRFAVVGVIGTSVMILPFTLYREPITQEVYAQEDLVREVSETDLLVERGSSETLIPKGRSRMDVISYTVKGGDTLSTIAEQYGIGVQTLLWSNDMTENDFIKPGQTLKIPPEDGVIHEVEEGDTLASLAEEYEAAEQAIADVNWIDPPFTLTVGETLFIPDGTMPPPPEPVAPVVAAAPAVGSPSYGGYSAAPSAGRFLGWPVGGGAGVVTQCASAWHVAIDIADSSYPPLVAASAGTVTFAGMSDPWGYAWSVQIDHGNGFSTFYAHMSQISVVSGQYVGRGQTIGTMGATGLATGVHVHMELRSGGGKVNPAPYMDVHVCGY
jgi:murein DD-endopeptidase MepM/ murein hydrolase activator NlpD